MDINMLKHMVVKNLPIYFCGKPIKVVEIYETFGLVDIEDVNNTGIYVVDISTLSDKPYIENSICIDKL